MRKKLDLKRICNTTSIKNLKTFVFSIFVLSYSYIDYKIFLGNYGFDLFNIKM